MEKGGTKSAIVKSIVLVALAAIIILGFYLLLTRNKKAPDEENYVLTTVDEITTTDLDKNYPANPRKVVDLYAKIMQTLYKEEYTDEQETKMIDVLGGIFDDELRENQFNLQSSIKNEVSSRKAEDYGISAYAVQEKNPEIFTKDGRDICSVDCLFTMRKGSQRILLYYQFVLRKDDEGRWKILGWITKDNNEG